MSQLYDTWGAMAICGRKIHKQLMSSVGKVEPRYKPPAWEPSSESVWSHWSHPQLDISDHLSPAPGHLCIPFCLQLNDILAKLSLRAAEKTRQLK